MPVLHRDRGEGLLGGRGFRQSTLLPREYRGQGKKERRRDEADLAVDSPPVVPIPALVSAFDRLSSFMFFLFFSFFQNIPPDLSQCVFVIEQALSVRALQELVTAAGSETVTYKFSLK